MRGYWGLALSGSRGYLKDQPITGRVSAINFTGKRFLLSLDRSEQKEPSVPNNDGEGDGAQAREVVKPVDGRSKTVNEYAPERSLVRAKFRPPRSTSNSPTISKDG